MANNKTRIAVVVASFNSAVTDSLLEGALLAADKHEADTEVYRVPGAFELPLLAASAARSGRYDAVVCLGAVIRGETPHFDYVCAQAAAGVQQVALEENMPVSFGVLTTDNIEQALARAGGEFGNKGYDAVVSAVDTLLEMRRLAAG
ncbi:MAG TPA: 6,7-dimethyl-8-ribityllumazine synthase [Deltaproteobacteria bacterium]|nr:6,7-dimethyl-8-ribityllumazine synthase [Candidatus Binatota bacterium]HIL14262.1 6,7-dimethyl-8-ribityllumazine synthase [Deltaproteobacteria bacterium]